MTKHFLCPCQITWRYLVGSHLTVVVTAEDGWVDLSFLCSIQSDKNRINTSTCGFKIVAGTSVLYCILSVTSDPNSGITRCFFTLLGLPCSSSWHQRFSTFCSLWSSAVYHWMFVFYGYKFFVFVTSPIRISIFLFSPVLQRHSMCLLCEPKRGNGGFNLHFFLSLIIHAN